MVLRYILVTFPLLTTAYAQVSINALNTPHTQDFNSLVTSGSVTWTDNSTLTGWYHARTGNGNLIVATNGNTTTGGFYSFGTGTDTERALGSIGSGNAAIGNIWYGIRLVNNTSATVNTVEVTYIGEQWRNSAASAQTVNFSYLTGTNLTSVADGAGSWINVPALDFTSPVTGGSAGALDGNSSVNRTTITSSITGLSISAGEEIILRWYDPDHSGSDHGLGIDDLTIVFQGSTLPTSVQFASASSSFVESAGTVMVAVSINNPSPSNATTVQVALTSGTASNGNDVQPAYSTQTLTFPAGSNANQTATLTIFDDASFEGNETLLFELQNVNGGNAAFIGAQSTHTLTILDNDLPPVPTVIVNEYFNANGNIASDEGVELIVVQDGLDMRGYSLADATSGGSYPFGVVTFSNDPLWSSLQAGTIIVIGGIFSVPANDTDASDGLLKIQAPAVGTSNQFFTHSSNLFSIAGSSDAVAIRDAGTNFIHGLAHGSSNSNTLPFGRHGWKSGNVSNSQSVHFSRNSTAMTDLDFVVNSYVGVGNNSLGNPNDTSGNRDYLRAKRSRTISSDRSLSGTFFWEVTINSGTVNLTDSVNICNALVINSGILNENAFGLSIDGSGNAQNGVGIGNVTVGDNIAPAALLNIFSNFGTISGTVDFNKTDGTIDYRGMSPQTVLPTTYGSLNLTFGSFTSQKTLQANATVTGTLSILNGAWLNVTPPAFITLGPTGLFINNGRFIGSVQSTRPTSAGVPEEFGGIGMTITPIAGNYSTTVRMTSGYYLWIGNLPSILKYYTVTPTGSYPASIVYSYLTPDLNGQTESGLGLKLSPDAGMTWVNQSGTLNTGTKTITLTAPNVGGIWTAHANPPQGFIQSDKTAITFEAEQNYYLPPAQILNITNQNGNGSIIEWSASVATTTIPSWIELVPTSPSGVNTGNFIVNVTRTDLNPGTYNGQIAVTDLHALNSPKIIPVTYIVHAPRRICLEVDTIFIKANYKKSNPMKAYTVLNCGGVFGSDVINWNASTTTPWLSLNPSSGVDGDALILRANTFQQNPGNTVGSITITGTHSLRGTPVANSPLVIPVVLEVEPVGDIAAFTGPLTQGNTHTLKNHLGQRVLDVRLVSGSISNINVFMLPMQLPEGMALLRYAYRHYFFEVDGSNYEIDVTLYYTSNELEPFMITAPSELRGWRQFPIKGMWYPTTSFSEPAMNRVTIQGITDLSGAWASATPMFPMTVRNGTLRAEWDESSCIVRWQSSMRLSDIGFLIERASNEKNDWATIGIVPFQEDGDYRFTDFVERTKSYDYRLVSIDRTSGVAYQSEVVTLMASTVLSESHNPSISEIELEQNFPNPVQSSDVTAIRFRIPKKTITTLTLYDVYGRKIKTMLHSDLERGEHTVSFNTSGLERGTYFYRLTTDRSALMKKLVIR